MSQSNTDIRRLDLALASLPYVALAGCAGVAANILLSFEEPHRGMLVASLLLIAAAPLGVMIHLATTDEMAPATKRRWFRGLVGRSALTLFTAYFTPSERRQATRRLEARQGTESGGV